MSRVNKVGIAQKQPRAAIRFHQQYVWPEKGYMIFFVSHGFLALLKNFTRNVCKLNVLCPALGEGSALLVICMTKYMDNLRSKMFTFYKNHLQN